SGACARSQPVQVHWLRTLRLGLLQKLLQLRPRGRVGDDLLPALLALLSEQEAREIRHLDPLGLGQRFADTDEFLGVAAHGTILHAAGTRSTPTASRRLTCDTRSSSLPAEPAQSMSKESTRH